MPCKSVIFFFIILAAFLATFFIEVLSDFLSDFTRTIHVQYMYNTCTTVQKRKFIDSDFLKSNWNPPVQQSVAEESYLEEVKLSLAEINLAKPKNNLPPAEREALKALKGDKQINLRKADNDTNTVVMNEDEKINGQIQLNVREHNRPLESPMVEEPGNES